jgi:acyl-CoA ligase (AMP-forming) (exosortase A-associated)
MDFLVHHLLRSSVCHFPEKEALVHEDKRLTYAEMAEQTSGLAYGLQGAGLRRGDRIGIYLGSSIPQVISIFGISQAGGVFVPINDGLFPNSVAHIAKDCGMTGLITDAAKLDELLNVLVDIPSLEFVVVVNHKSFSPLSLTLHGFEELCELNPAHLKQDEGIGNDLAAILYTSGSTGKPKGVMLSHRNVIDAASIMSACLEFTQDERILAILPFSFDAGLNQVTTTVQQGGTLILMNFVFAKQIVQMLLKERISGMTGVPTLWALLAQPNSTLQQNQYPNLRYISNTGGTLPQRVLKTLQTALPTTKIFLRYGQTETFLSTCLPWTELSRRPTSIGKALPNTELLVIDDEGQICKSGEIGELVHRGPIMSMGYWGQADLTERTFRSHPFLSVELSGATKVCYSGDLIKLDEDGFLYFVGRRDSMIKSSGFRISPTEVEEILFQSGKLQAAAVIGVPDDLLGQHIKAFVVPCNGSPIDVDGLRIYCAKRLPRYMVPQLVEIVDELPLTGNGKVDYPALRRREGLHL